MRKIFGVDTLFFDFDAVGIKAAVYKSKKKTDKKLEVYLRECTEADLKKLEKCGFEWRDIETGDEHPAGYWFGEEGTEKEIVCYFKSRSLSKKMVELSLGKMLEEVKNELE